MSRKRSSSTSKGRGDRYDMPGTAKSMETEDDDRDLEHEVPGEDISTKSAESDDDMPSGNMNGDEFRASDNGNPQTRRCGTMDVHRRLLSIDPQYARARNEIENLTLR